LGEEKGGKKKKKKKKKKQKGLVACRISRSCSTRRNTSLVSSGKENARHSPPLRA